MKKMLLLLVCLTTFAWLHADKVTIDFSQQGYKNAQEVTSVNAGNDITIEFTGGSPKAAYYTSGKAVRTYNSGKTTISSTAGNITKIEFTFGSNKFTASETKTSGEWSSQYTIWTGDAKSVTFTNPKKNGQVHFQKMVITYTNTGVATPKFSPEPGNVEVGEEVSISCTTEGAKIYYTTDGNEPTASSTEYTAPIIINAETTIKAIAIKDAEKSTVAEAKYTPIVAMPTFSVAEGAVQPNTEVAISCTTPGATIKYSLNGSTEFIEYTDPIVITEATTISAYATSGSLKSETAEVSYTIIGKLEGEQTETLVFSNEYSLDTDLNGVTIKLNDYISITFSKNGGDNPPMYYKSGSALRMYPKNKFAITAVDGVVVKSIVFATPAGYKTLESSSTKGYANGYWSGNESEVTFVESRTSGQSRVLNIAITYAPKTAANQVELPVFSHEEGEIIKGTKVEITCPTEGATIHYTTDGTEPTTDSPVYSEPIEVNADMTIKALAVKVGFENSFVAEISYKAVLATLPTPTFDPASGTVEKNCPVNISCPIDGVKVSIYYTTDGKTPTAESTLYTAPIVVETGMTISAIAIAEGYNNSAVATATFSVEGEAPMNPTATFDFTQPSTLQPALIPPTTTSPNDDQRVQLDKYVFYNNYALVKFTSPDGVKGTNWSQLWNGSDGPQVRAYKGSTITITVAESLTIEKIEFVGAVSSANLKNISYTGSLGSYSGTTGTWTRGGGVKAFAETIGERESVSFNVVNEGIRLNQISVTTTGKPTGVEDVTVDENAPVEYYNLQGVRVDNPENGIYIRRQGSKVSKVLVR